MLEIMEITITPLGRRRNLRVYLPPGYHENDRHYPVLYMFDGQNVFRDEDARFGMSWRMGEALEAEGLEMIVAALDSHPDGTIRLNEYGPWENPEIAKDLGASEEVCGGEGKMLAEYLVHELKPFIDRTYRTIKEDSSIAGSSMGGLISTYIACVYPQVFKRAASFSSAYWFNQKEMESLIGDSDLHGIEKFYMDVGTEERSGEVSEETYIKSSESVYALMKEKMEHCRFDIIEGAVHNELAWSKRLPAVLRYLYL
ncbi:alpha/beta hydrolase [Peribacillus sp. SCS-26]|uniref:alpha/beta hydrolase n=1 Tax=Paraperibacillus marinus TaxID=3115295 RepID=UPI003905A058